MHEADAHALEIMCGNAVGWSPRWPGPAPMTALFAPVRQRGYATSNRTANARLRDDFTAKAMSCRHDGTSTPAQIRS